MNGITLESVKKSFDGKAAVKDLTLSVQPGEVRGLLGPNGSGKSTTMKMIMGIIKPDYGKINLCGVNVLQQPLEAKKLVGYVSELPYLYEYLTGSEYLDFVGTAYRIDLKSRRERVDELLQALQMHEHINEVMSGFSQGMKQKIAFTAALLHRPKALVLDEVLNGLDPRSATRAVLVANSRFHSCVDFNSLRSPREVSVMARSCSLRNSLEGAEVSYEAQGNDEVSRCTSDACGDFVASSFGQ